ncbi:MAG: UPF0158 family protein [Planctomycetes bacterium]|nr:UPF0158 family protein [Planctomycetota bacterium]
MTGPIEIKLDELGFAFEDASFEHEHLLDRMTGEVLMVSAHEDDEETCERIDADPDRHVHVPPADPHAGYRDMEEFAEAIEEPRLRELLAVALRGKGAFRRFKDVLCDFPEERKRWFEFHDERLRRRATEWLDSLGIAWREAAPGRS